MKWNALKKYDSWNMDRLIRHFAYWGLWSAFFVNLNYLVKSSTPYTSWLFFELFVLPVKISCAYTVAYFLMPRFLYKKRYLTFIVSTAISMMIYGYLLFLVYKFLVSPVMHFRDAIEFNLEFFYKSLELVHISALVVCIKFFQNHLHQEKINSELRQEKIEAELKFLKNQIQPHFLFNTLNNLYGLVLSNDTRAPNLIVKLSEMLGYMLYDSAAKTVMLTQELENLKNYIALERMRYDRKLDLNIELENVPDDVEIAPMLLVPFVENAFKHGPAKEDKTSAISIRASYSNDQLHFMVENTFTSDQNDQNIKSGIGLLNVKKRLQLIYPHNHILKVEKSEMFRISLILNLDKAKNE